MFSFDCGLIPACDVDSLDKLRSLIRVTSRVEGVVGYKIGFMLALKFSLGKVVETIREYTDLPIIYDHQKAGTDIPEMAAPFARICREAGVNDVIIFPQAGPESEVAFIKEIQNEGMIPIVGGEMTHPKYLEKEGGFLKDDAPGQIFKIAALEGVKYFVLPGNRPESIGQYLPLLDELGGKTRLLLPGLGRQGGYLERVFQVTGVRSTYFIIGSTIYNSEDMKKTVREICRRIFRLKVQKRDETGD